MFCRHKYGKIEDGYQHCTKCNKAIVVPCNHKWNKLKEYRAIKRYEMWGTQESIEYHLQCEHCGNIKVAVC